LTDPFGLGFLLSGGGEPTSELVGAAFLFDFLAMVAVKYKELEGGV
jgi:hypothetical protein